MTVQVKLTEIEAQALCAAATTCLEMTDDEGDDFLAGTAGDGPTRSALMKLEAAREEAREKRKRPLFGR